MGIVAAAMSVGLLAWLAGGFGPESPPELQPASEEVRVRVRDDATRLLLACEAGLELLHPQSMSLDAQIELQHRPGGFSILQPGQDARVLDTSELLLRWTGQATARFAPEDEPQRWYGGLRLEHLAKGMRVIAHVDLERYVSGVLMKEMSPSFTPDALAAQAVAARSYVLEAKERAQHKSFDVFGDTRSQVYAGASEHPRILRAIAVTSGLVLAFEGRVLRCYFSSTCGGRTRDGRERFADVPAPPFRSVICEACAISPAFTWRKEIAPDAWYALGVRGPPQRIQVVEKSERGDWKRVRLESDRYPAVSLRGSELARQLNLRSTWIDDVTEEGELRTIHGRGFGHGAGMCQWGAEGYGRRGWTWQRILAHYYPDAELLPYSRLKGDGPR